MALVYKAKFLVMSLYSLGVFRIPLGIKVGPKLVERKRHHKSLF